MNLTDYNEIRALLNRHKFRFSKSMGQNFLTAAWVPEDIAASAMLDEDTGVLEIGPGVGCLTQELSKRAGKVLCVELDNALKPILAETLSECGNVSAQTCRTTSPRPCSRPLSRRRASRPSPS